MFVKQCAAICLLSGISYASDEIPASEQSEFQATQVIAEAAADAEVCIGLYGLENSAFMAVETFDIDQDPTIVLGLDLGNLWNVFDSDDVYALVGAQAAYTDGIDAGWVCIDSYGTSSNPSSPTSIEVSYELDMSYTGNRKFKYRLSVFNWVTGVYDHIVPYTQLYGPFGSDQIITATITSDVSDYINQNTCCNNDYLGRISSRICIYSPKVGMAYPIYTVKFDHISYTVNN